MNRFKMLWSCAALLTTAPFAGCEDGKGSGKADTGVAADSAAPSDTNAEAETVTPSDTNAEAETATPSDTTVAETAADSAATTETTPGDTQVASCSEADLAACEYPSRGLAYTEFDGIATTEPQTGRTLPLHVRIPTTPGPLPVVIWSHGGGFTTGGQLNSDEWGDLFAKHGFVVIHVGHAELGLAGAGTLCTLASVPEAECVQSPDEDANGIVAIGRSYDLVAVLDDLPRLSQLSVAKGGPALDLARVVVAGWSGGSRGPMVLMGAKVKPTASAPIFTNPHARPVAAIFMSPAGPGFGGWYETESDNSWIDLRGPTFTATGTNDQKVDKPELTGAVRRMSFPLQPGDGKRALLFSNLPVGVGGHSTYNLEDTGSGDARLSRLSRAIGSVARAFLDASVDGDADARAWLLTDHARILAGDAEWLRR